MGIFKTIFSFFLDIVETIVVAMSVFVIVYLFFLQPHQVVGNSMLPNFHDKEYILTDKISYRFREPTRGEIVIFKSPEDKDKDFIKRIIALPHEKIRIAEGRIFVNNKELREDYLDPDSRTSSGKFLAETQEITIPSGEYIVLGDNRLNSSDSRAWGTINASKIIGKALLVYWPLNRSRLVKTVYYR